MHRKPDVKELYPQSQDLERAVEILKVDGVVGFPTETVYGLGASIYSSAGIKRIFEIKERPYFDPLIVHISDLDQMKEVVSSWPDVADVLTRQFWPGPLTLVLPKNPSLNSLITSGLETVGVRMPRHSIALDLLRQLRAPIAAPSANKFGRISPTRVDHVRAEFGSELFVLDGGPCEIGVESTVLGIEESGVVIYRPGMIGQRDIETCLEAAGHKLGVQRQESIRSPGHLKRHYCPKIPLIIVRGEFSEDQRVQIERKWGSKNLKWRELVLLNEPWLVARTLYASLREMADEGIDYLVIAKRPTHRGEFWDAIWDRLERAAHFSL